jgi:hypothetical protein
MGKNKKYLIKTVNLGEEKDPARILIEKYLKGDKSTKMKSREQEFSKLMRRLIVYFFSTSKEFDEWKKQALIFERKEISKDINSLIEKKKANTKELEKFGVDVSIIDFG